MTASATEKAAERTANHRPCVIEFGDASQRRITLATFREHVRGAWDLQRLHERPDGGRDVGVMQKMPNIPGMRMRVSIDDSEALLYDPLEDDPGLVSRINNAAVAAGIRGAGWTFVSRSVRKMEKDTLKTLLFELRELIDEGLAWEVEGRMLSASAIEQLPGRRLFDRLANSSVQPRYSDEVEEWTRRLNSAHA